MNFETYNKACAGLFQEIEESLSQADIDELTQLCANLGLQEFCAWFDRHRQEVEKYVQATPSARKKRKSWHKDKTHTLYLKLSALIYLKGSLAMLEQLCTCADSIHHGSSYREFAHQAGIAYLDVKCRPFSWWPLPDYDNPFV